MDLADEGATSGAFAPERTGLAPFRIPAAVSVETLTYDDCDGIRECWRGGCCDGGLVVGEAALPGNNRRPARGGVPLFNALALIKGLVRGVVAGLLPSLTEFGEEDSGLRNLTGERAPLGAASFGVRGGLFVRLKAALSVGVSGLGEGPLGELLLLMMFCLWADMIPFQQEGGSV